MTRRRLPVDVTVEVLVKSRRRCALCFGLEGETSQQRGQLAHVDRNTENNAFENLCFLCLRHHDEYDTRPSQSKGFPPSELLRYRAALYEFLEKQPAPSWPDSPRPRLEQHAETSEYSVVHLYSRRRRIYQATKDLIGAVVQHVYVEPEELSSFIRDTDEAIFLFDDEIADYLFTLYRQAVQLEYIGKKLEDEPTGATRNALAEQERDVLIWFTEQFSVLRQKFIPFMRAPAVITAINGR